MKTYTVLAFILATLLLPTSAYAHATPVTYVPGSSEELPVGPSEIRIRFSERLESGASRISVTNEAGSVVSVGKASVDTVDTHILSIPVESSDTGTFFVSWSVISSDDGHFTKGGYAYFVGVPGTDVPTTAQVEVVQLSALPEATAIFVELLGNSILWGVIILFAWVIRPQMPQVSERQRILISRGYSALILIGVTLVVGAGLSHLILKTSELAILQGSSFFEVLPAYLATVSGSATIVRALCAIAIGSVFLLCRNSILRAVKIAPAEIFFLLALFVFAFFRSKVSHATANPFLPDLSLLMNFIHLIGKDLWAGMVGTLSLFFLSRTVRPLIGTVLPRAFALISVAFGAVALTAPYIVWLHLKDVANLTTTLWGERFIPLLVSAVLAVVLLLWHVLVNTVHPKLVGRFLPYTLPAEFALGVLIVFFSSLMIITSPPTEGSLLKTFTAQENGATIALARSQFEDGKALVTIEGRGAIGEPTVFVDNEGEGGLLIELERRFDGGYVFPVSLLTPGTPHTIDITATQEGGYDARASFTLERADLEMQEEGTRTLDVFGVLMLLIALCGGVLAWVLYRASHTVFLESVVRRPASIWILSFGVALIVASQCIGLATMFLANTYKKECVADGNAWHLMLPMRNGLPVSSVPQEGCMALGGSFHIADAREYRFLKSPGTSTLTFSTDRTSLSAGVPTSLDFSITSNGEPALLSVAHERLVHVIVISADMNNFYHLHPDDTAPLTSEEIQNATFRVPFTFPTGGEYLVAVDYVNGLLPQSTYERMNVAGSVQEAEPTIYRTKGVFDGYDVTLTHGLLLAGQPSTLLYRVTKEGNDVTDLAPYLAAAMHVAIVKNDLNEFVHTHGEVHLPGTPVVPLASTTVHNHAPPPPRFGPVLEAHPTFPTPGMYTVFGQFMHEGKIVVTRFTVKAE